MWVSDMSTETAREGPHQVASEGWGGGARVACQGQGQACRAGVEEGDAAAHSCDWGYCNRKRCQGGKEAINKTTR